VPRGNGFDLRLYWRGSPGAEEFVTAYTPEGCGLERAGRADRQMAGSPRGIAPPGLPQIRTCPIRASGSSSYGFAVRRYTEWTTTAAGSGRRFSSRLKWSHVSLPSRRRRPSHIFQMRCTMTWNTDNAWALPVTP